MNRFQTMISTFAFNLRPYSLENTELAGEMLTGTALHLSTFQLNLSRFITGLSMVCATQLIPQKNLRLRCLITVLSGGMCATDSTHPTQRAQVDLKSGGPVNGSADRWRVPDVQHGCLLPGVPGRADKCHSCHVINCVLDPIFLSQISSYDRDYDLACVISWALVPGEPGLQRVDLLHL